MSIHQTHTTQSTLRPEAEDFSETVPAKEENIISEYTGETLINPSASPETTAELAETITTGNMSQTTVKDQFTAIAQGIWREYIRKLAENGVESRLDETGIVKTVEDSLHAALKNAAEMIDNMEEPHGISKEIEPVSETRTDVPAEPRVTTTQTGENEMTEVKKNSSGTVPAKEETEMEEESKAGLLEPGTKYAIANLKGKPMLFRHGWPMRDVGYDGNWEDHWYDDYGMYRPDEVWNVRAKDATLFDEEELEELETFLGQLWYPQSEGFWSLAMLAPESEVFLVPEGLVKSFASRNRTTAKDFERVKKEGVRLSAYLLRKWYGLNRA